MVGSNTVRVRERERDMEEHGQEKDNNTREETKSNTCELLVDLHAGYIRKASKAKGSVEYEFTEHLRMSGVYWGVTALALIRRGLGETEQEEEQQRRKLVEWVLSCQDLRGARAGGFSGNNGHAAHMLYTYSAVQILALMDNGDMTDKRLNEEVRLGGGGGGDGDRASDDHNAYKEEEEEDGHEKKSSRSRSGSSSVQNEHWLQQEDGEVVTRREAIIRFVSSLQNEDGSFCGDEWGEVDTRFSYCAVACLSLLGALDRINVDAAVDFVASCRNFDGGFGSCPGGESHAGQVFTCVAALAICGRDALEKVVDRDVLGWWLCERQVDGGGLNGRPEKLEDVCYSWWVLSSLKIINRMDWIHAAGLRRFILNAQDDEDGGISDRPSDMADVYHTFFGIAGLSLLGLDDDADILDRVDPVYALPEPIVRQVFHYQGRNYDDESTFFV